MPVVAALVLTLAFQSTVTPEVTAARKIAKDAEAYATKNNNARRMHMLQGKKWVVMKKDTDHLKDEMWREDVSVVAFSYQRSGKTFLVFYTGGSPSGDWSADKVCVYRPDGSLAHTNYRFAGFMFGGLALEEETVHNSKGKKIFSQFKLTDLNNKPRKSKEEQSQMLSNRPVIKDYLKASQLPFTAKK